MQRTPGCPSGQRERTVNPPALPSKVRILYLAQLPVEWKHSTGFLHVRALCPRGRCGVEGEGPVGRKGRGSRPACQEGLTVGVGAPFSARCAHLRGKVPQDGTISGVLAADLCNAASSGYSTSGFRSWGTEQQRCWEVRTVEHAPLAQSAERFHGKEKVDSSILSGGSSHFEAHAGLTGCGRYEWPWRCSSDG